MSEIEIPKLSKYPTVLPADKYNIYGIYGEDGGLTEAQAAEVIRRAEAYNPWIPVSEGLPKEKGYINVADTKTKTPQTWYWENTNIQADLLKAYFTHWKPIILPDQALKEQSHE